MEENIFKMSESELGDYIDELMSHKVDEQVLPKDVTIESIYKDIYKHIRIYSRILQLQLNHIKARADMGKFFMIAMCRAMPKDKADLIMAEVIKLKDEANKKTMEEINSRKESKTKLV